VSILVRSLTLAAFVAACVGAPGCSSCGEASKGAAGEAGAPAVLGPVPAPAGLLAQAWIRSPDAAWGTIQRGVSGVVALLPSSVGEVACGYAGVDSRLAKLVDGKGTSLAALGDDGAGGVAWVIAVPLTDPGAAASMLLGGPAPGDPAAAGDASAPYTAREVDGMRVLAGGAGRELAASVALAGSFLLVAPRAADLTSLGPYAFRTMATLAPPAGSSAITVTVPAASLAGPVASRLGRAWEEQRAWLDARDEEQRAKHGGRAPDFGDPRPIIDALDGFAKAGIATLAHGQGARVEIDPGEDDVHAEAFVTPGEGDAGASALASMTTGDAAPLLKLPADAAVAVLRRDAAASRLDDARATEDALERVLGDRARGEDGKAIHAALEDWAKARGDWWAAALAWGTGEASRGLWVRTPARDADASTRAVRELVDLSHRRAFADLLAGAVHLSPASVATADVPSLGKATVATFPWALKDAGGKGPRREAPPVPGVAWGVRDGQLVLAAGFAAAPLLSAGAAPAHVVGDDARAARALAALGADASLAVYAQPLRLDAVRSADAASAPAVAGWGRKGGDAWLRIELADALVREVVRWSAR
jgi:hypothetical protein